MREVVITGAGVVSPLGNTPARFANRLFEGGSGIGPVTRFDTARFQCRLAGEAHAEGLDDAISGSFAHEMVRMDRFVRYSVIAARGACRESGVGNGHGIPPRGAVYVGVGMGGLPNIETGILRQEARGPRKTLPYLIPSLIPNMAASMVSLDLAFEGPQYTFSSACASGNQALGAAFHAIRAGDRHWALAGGSEAVITPITFSGFQAMHALSYRNDACTPRPFDRARDGMIVGEGAAMFVLEEAEHAASRGATVLGRITGYATTTGGGGITLRSSSAASRCMSEAVEDSGLAAAEIDLIFAQAPGMPHDDRELAAITTTFDDCGVHAAITSAEGHLGHTFAASGPLSLLAALSAFERQEIPPTLNLDEPAAGFEPLDLVTERRSARIDHCLINSFGFGGVNASLVCSRA